MAGTMAVTNVIGAMTNHMVVVIVMDPRCRQMRACYSRIVDTIYGHTVESGVTGVSESVAKRAGFHPAPLPEPPPPPTPVGPPRLRVIEGGRIDLS